MSNRFLVIFMASLLMQGCRQKEVVALVEYTGPLREAGDVEMLYSEKDRIKVMMKAKKILEFKNEDKEFPEGLYLEFYDEFGKMTSTLKANSAFYFKEKNQWRARGNVEVINLAKKQQLNTEELFWKPDTKKIFTEKFVTIKLESEVIYGTGLDAVQDLSTYSIKKPEGEFEIKD
jgi:LPS export ABC transporter protein LptC